MTLERTSEVLLTSYFHLLSRNKEIVSGRKRGVSDKYVACQINRAMSDLIELLLRRGEFKELDSKQFKKQLLKRAVRVLDICLLETIYIGQHRLDIGYLCDAPSPQKGEIHVALKNLLSDWGSERAFALCTFLKFYDIAPVELAIAYWEHTGGLPE